MSLDFNDFQDEVRRKNITIEKSFDPFYIDPDQLLDIEKGKRAQIGEIRTHGGVKVQKQGDGSWKPVKDGGGKKEIESPSKGDSSGEGEVVFRFADNRSRGTGYVYNVFSDGSIESSGNLRHNKKFSNPEKAKEYLIKQGFEESKK